jgi:hypothetical protein
MKTWGSVNMHLTAHVGHDWKLRDEATGLSGIKWWLRYLTVEPQYTESLVVTSWGLLQYLKSLLHSLRLMTKLDVYKTISVYLQRYPLVAQVLQGVPNMVAEQCELILAGFKGRQWQNGLGNNTARFGTATVVGVQSSDSVTTSQSTEDRQSSVCEQCDQVLETDSVPETWEWGNEIDEGDEITISMMNAGADPDEDSDDEKKNKPIGKPPLFSGAEKDWSDYSWRMLSWCSLIKLDAYMEEAAKRPIPVTIAAEPAKTQKKAALLYHYLINSLQGKALSMLRSVDRSNGFEAWRKLCLHYQPQVVGRHMSVLTGLMSVTFGNKDLLQDIENWEVAVDKYQHDSTEDLALSVRAAIFLKALPSKLQEVIRLSGTKVNDYVAMRSVVLEYVRAGQKFDTQGSLLTRDDTAPMDIGFIKGGKGKKGKGTGSWGGSSSSHGSTGNGKGSQYRSDSVHSQKKTGACKVCGKEGHWAKECWYNTGQKGQQSPSWDSQKGSGKSNKGKGKGFPKGKSKGKGKVMELGQEPEAEAEVAQVENHWRLVLEGAISVLKPGSSEKPSVLRYISATLRSRKSLLRWLR